MRGKRLAAREHAVVEMGRDQEQHAVAARGGEPVGEHAAGRAGPDDDVVEGLRVAHRRLPVCRKV